MSESNLDAVINAGVEYSDAVALRRASMTLRRWYEGECGDGNEFASWAIERDEETNRPYRVVYPHRGETKRYLIADRETGARRRIARILLRYPGIRFYIQTDPRGCALYLIRPGDVPTGEDVSAYYTRGIAVY